MRPRALRERLSSPLSVRQKDPERSRVARGCLRPPCVTRPVHARPLRVRGYSSGDGAGGRPPDSREGSPRCSTAVPENLPQLLFSRPTVSSSDLSWGLWVSWSVILGIGPGQSPALASDGPVGSATEQARSGRATLPCISEDGLEKPVGKTAVHSLSDCPWGIE